MKKRLYIVTALVAFLILLGFAGFAGAGMFFLESRPSLVTRQQYGSLNIGMSITDLEYALGPPRNELRNRVIVWAPKDDGKLVSTHIAPGTSEVRFFPDADTGSQTREVVWLSKSGLIAASIDQNGRLRDKYFSVVHDPGGPSATGWLRSRPEEMVFR